MKKTKLNNKLSTYTLFSRLQNISKQTAIDLYSDNCTIAQC